MDNKNASPPTAEGDFNDRNHPLVLMLNIGIHSLRTLGLVTLILTSLFFLRLVIAHPLYIYDHEVAALMSLQNEVQSGASSAVDAGSVTSGLTGAEVGVAGVATVAVPPIVWLIVCIIAAIWLVFLIEKQIRNVITLWQAVSVCRWTRSFWSFLGCLWQVIWAVLNTVFIVFLILLLVVCVLSNIAALVATIA